jgi:hypothetical protein
VKLCNSPDRIGAKARHLAHERLDGLTGQVLIQAEFLDVSGNPDERTLFIRVRTGYLVQAGLRIGFYKPAEWGRAKKRAPINDKKLTVISTKALGYGPELCTRQVRVTGDVWRQMTTFAGFMVLAMDVSRKATGFPVPMAGLKEADLGPETKRQSYDKPRAKLIRGLGGKP